MEAAREYEFAAGDTAGGRRMSEIMTPCQICRGLPLL